MSAAVFEERVDPGQIASAMLAAVVHLILFAVLVFGVNWQNRPPDTIAVELWEPPPAPVQAEPKPAPAVEPAPLPKPEAQVQKPDIVEKKAPPPKPVPKQIVKVEPKPVLKPAPLKPRVDEAKRFQEELAREQTSMQVDNESRRIKEMLAREAASANAGALASWKGKVALHIRNRIREEIAQAVPGNPEAIFVVRILPTYEVLKISKVKSSGNAAYDDDVERAILKASPLPRPDKPELFDPELRMSFRPKDK